MRGRLAFGLVTTLALSVVHAQDAPPSLMWAREYFPEETAKFRCAVPSGTESFLVAGYSWIPSQQPMQGYIIRTDEDGAIEWIWQPDYYISSCNWLEELTEGAIITCGVGQPEQDTPPGIMLARLNGDGQTEWINYWTALESDAYCVIQLPDGGYALCGAINSYDPYLVRTDSQGDTLWTRVWEPGWARARRVVYHDNGLVMFVDGSFGYGPLLIRYDMDGDLEWVSDFTGEYESSTEWGGSMCLTPGGGGYTFVSEYYSWLVGTDWSGEKQWSQEIYGDMGRIGLLINPTMDGGYIFSGTGSHWSQPEAVNIHSAPADTGSTWDGWLVKMDPLGNHEWHVFNSLGARANYFNCVQQLSQGGYIVAGQIQDAPYSSNWNGYLLRYAPETGIGGEENPEPVLQLHPSSNPFSSSVAITCEGESLPGQLMVYDITGRLIRSLSDREGASFTWDGRDGSGADAPTGTYLIQGAVDGQVSSIRVVRL